MTVTVAMGAFTLMKRSIFAKVALRTSWDADGDDRWFKWLMMTY